MTFEQFKATECPYASCENFRGEHECLCDKAFFEKVIEPSEQFQTLFKIAKRKQRKAMRKVGKIVDEDRDPNELFQICLHYPEDRMIKQTDKDGMTWWDVPSYTNGTTRHAQCLFRISPKTEIGHGYCVGAEPLSKYEHIRQESETEKLLIQEHFGDHLVELVWTWDWAPHKERNVYRIGVGDYYMAVKVNGKKVKTLENYGHIYYNHNDERAIRRKKAQKAFSYS